MNNPVKITFLSWALLSLLVLSCREKQAITPCFTILNDSFRDPREPVTFINCSEGADSYIWDFGDGETSTEASPTHQYASTGVYAVTLRGLNPDFDEAIEKSVVQDFPRLKNLIISQLPTINPKNNLPYDPEGNGYNCYLEVYDAEQSGPRLSSGPLTAMTLPFEFSLAYMNSNSIYWGFLLTDLSTPSHDSILWFGVQRDDLLSSPTLELRWDSIDLEIQLAGYPL